MPPEPLSEIRSTILSLLKAQGPNSIAGLAQAIGVSYEAVRMQMVQLEKDGWIVGQIERSGAAQGGRPTASYRLTAAGEHRFPKRYDALAVELVDTAARLFGAAAVKQILAEVTAARVRRWAPLLQGKPLAQRLELLKGVYLDDDAFMSIERDGEALRLVERNCPFLNVALARPALCSVTVSTLTQLLGMRVVREKRFQNGDGCCAFRILEDQPLAGKAQGFELEP